MPVKSLMRPWAIAVVPIVRVEAARLAAGMRVTTTYDLSDIRHLTIVITTRERLSLGLWSALGTVALVNGLSYAFRHQLELVFSLALALILVVAFGFGAVDRTLAESRAERRARSELGIDRSRAMPEEDLAAFLAGRKPGILPTDSSVSVRLSAPNRNRIGQASKVIGVLSILMLLPVAQTFTALFALGLSLWGRRYSAEMDERGVRALRVGFVCSLMGLVLSFVVLIALVSLSPSRGAR